MRIPSTTVHLGAVIAATGLSLAVASPAFAAPSFSDVPDNAWYGPSREACVSYVVEEDIMTGYAGTDLFGPDDTLTRAQAVTTLYRMITGDPDGLTSNPASYAAHNESGFADAQGGVYYTAALNWAAAEGIAQGYDGFFRPNDPVTREELLTFMDRAVVYEDSPIYVQENSYPIDEHCEQVSEWATEAVDNARLYRIIEGDYHRHADPKKTFNLLRVRDNATRAEAAAMLMRLNENVVVYIGLDPKIAIALRQAETLEEGVDFEAGVLFVHIDGTIAVEGSELCFGDYARAQINASREASKTGDPAAQEMKLVDATMLGLPQSGGVDALSVFGKLDLISGSNRGSVDVGALVKIPEGMSYADALHLLAADGRVLSASLDVYFSPEGDEASDIA